MEKEIDTPTPNSAQKEAIEHKPAPLMIIAGAGTGKTFTLENRIIYLVKNYNVNPRNILAITYTEKGALELKNRISNSKYIGSKAEKMSISTFHSFCYKLLNDFSDSTAELLEQSEAIHMLLQRFDELSPFDSDEFPLAPHKAIIESFIPFFNRIKDELIDIDTIEVPSKNDENELSDELVNQIKDLKRIYPRFQKWKKELNLVDYGDIIFSTFKLLSNNNKILKEAQNHYRHVIIDEFQDNNYAINKIIGLIVNGRESITVVGDDDQVIYSFRGANVFNINNFENTYKHNKNYKFIALEENFRSTKPILELSNHVIKKNSDRKEKNLFTNINRTGKLPFKFSGSVGEQLQFISSEIKLITKSGTAYNDIAILCRTHSQTAKVINHLRSVQIPVETKKKAFFSIPEIREIIAWCQLIGTGKYAEISLYRIIRSLLGEEKAYNFYSEKNNKRVSFIIDQLKNDNILNQTSKIKNFIENYTILSENNKKKSSGEIVWEICVRLKFLKSHANNYTYDDHFILLNVGQLLKKSQSFTKRNKKNNSLFSFNIYIDAVMKSGGIQSIPANTYRESIGIKVKTIHGVKGAEFPIVFIPFLRSASFPLNYKKNKKINLPPDEWLHYQNQTNLTPREHHYQEERRLFYVGITRAKTALYLLAPPKATSILIKDIDDKYVEDIIMKENLNNIEPISDLKIKYEQKLQQALSREDYSLVNNYSSALSKIKDFENGTPINLGDTDWEIELNKNLKKGFSPKISDKMIMSASAIETYKTCALKYRLARLDGIPQTASKPQLLFGNIIHKVLQRFHEDNKEISERRIKRLLDEEWKTGEFDYNVREEKFKEQGLEILINYYNRHKNEKPKVISREEKFQFELGNIIIKGAIDRIDVDFEGTHIIDYKTSKTPSNPKKNLQLAVYSIYLEQLKDSDLGGLPGKASLYFLRESEEPIRTHAFTSEELGKTKEDIIEVASNIQNRNFEPSKGMHCEWCDYKDLICPAWE